MLSMSSFDAKSVNSCPNFDVLSCSGTILLLLLREGMVGGGEGGRAEEIGSSAMVNGGYR